MSLNLSNILPKAFIFLLLWIATFPLLSQKPKRYHAGELRHQLEKLNVLGSVLYVAAHPDDENTRLITYLANEKHLRTAYLSATRGDGGQNLIGPEIREALGVIRTQELLAARRMDGGQQFFTRANDFGYSKHPDETFNIWDRNGVLADFVWTYRRFRPDIVVTRFNKTPGTNHGHHTASAILAHEAFTLAGDREAFPDQLDDTDPWQPRRIYWNTGWWWFRSGYDTSNLAKVNVGAYDPLLGKSYTEIASESRSMHKSQGFGASGSRGDELEYLEQWDGDPSENVFDGMDFTWGRVAGSQEVAFFINKAIEDFDEKDPSQIVASLMAARASLLELEDQFWKTIKLAEIDELIFALTGTFMELTTDEPFYTPGDTIQVSLEVINRSDLNFSLKDLKFDFETNPMEFNTKLMDNRPFETSMTLVIPEKTPYSDPYWLNENASLGMYHVEDQLLRGTPENQPAISARIALALNDQVIEKIIPVVYKYTDRVKGEVYEPLVIGPPVMISREANIQIFGENQPKKVAYKIIAGKDNVSGTINLKAPKGWSVHPAAIDYALQQKGQEQSYTFEINPPSKSSIGTLKASVEYQGNTYDRGKMVLDYDHIPKQTLFPPSSIKLVKLDLDKTGDKIGYIMGAGDVVPENLSNIGFEVDLLEKEAVDANNLAQYDAVILGVRAFNTLPWMTFKNQELFKYAEHGGTVIVQYNTTRGLLTDDVAPYPVTLSSDRVTVEEAEVRILEPDHPVLNTPNKITSEDFDDWVQERGLYFPNQWSEEFIPILSSNDPGETPKNGGLLVAKHGKGYYIYTGYSWFRELPAGVPGAYRLFVNMISLGNE